MPSEIKLSKTERWQLARDWLEATKDPTGLVAQYAPLREDIAAFDKYLKYIGSRLHQELAASPNEAKLTVVFLQTEMEYAFADADEGTLATHYDNMHYLLKERLQLPWVAAMRKLSGPRHMYITVIAGCVDTRSS